MELGLRVVRGPDWKWGNQDTGEGHVGTVVEIGRPGSQTSPDKTVVVQWDSGARTNYRVGYQGAYDLRIFDNAPVGVRHQNIICDSCKTQGVQGMRWKCTKCHDFDLCTLCYMQDEHDPNHSFMRFDTASTVKGVKVPKRSQSHSQKVQAMGVFAGARVCRGPDWDWGNQDGGEGKIGTVSEIRGWDSESGRSVAHVTWASGSTNVYRMGHKGKVDLKYKHVASGGPYYKDHLQVLGDVVAAQGGVTPSVFKVGDKVRCNLDMEVLKQMQEGHGGWNPRMADYINKMGVVHRITDRGDVRVQYDGCANRWTFHSEALTKVQVFQPDDFVRISDNLQQVKDWQAGHGEWTEVMKNTLGKIGVVKTVYSDGDMRVLVCNQEWTFNPLCCSLVPHRIDDMNNTLGSGYERDPMPAFTSILEKLEELQLSHGHETGPDRLVREAAQGHVEVVRDILVKYPDKVDQQSSGKTALQVASHQGHRDIVQLLLTSQASLEVKDEDGDTALHYSAFGNQPEVMQLLLSKGAKMDSLNNGGCSTLHVAVNKQHQECVKVLLQRGCNVNIQDAYGDTALHDAIGKENQAIIELLVAYHNIDFTRRNKRGFNVLHHSALKGNVFATEKVLIKCPQIKDLKKDDGFSSLHLAALNGHKDVAASLLTHGAEIEIRNNRQQTPLLLAVSQGHTSIIELLVSQGADVNVKDEDGDTCLHLALMRQTVATEDSSPMLDAIRSQLGMSEQEEQTGAAIACYLAQQGAELRAKNHQGKSPLDIISDRRVKEVVLQFATAFASNSEKSQVKEKESPKECELCCTTTTLVTFEPCGHTIVCADCCVNMKKCIECKRLIDLKRAADGSIISSGHNPSSSLASEEEAFLKKRLQELEDTINCPICMERQKNRVFQCGHATCGTCADSLRNCPICRKVIKQKINLF
ncbi:E3 ubiquitin-protein ligase MIB2 [Aplysia californica]|uniref:RING-type E3 ubiquitin transferase n=1 Tax=Aplysia californica TaxID=6500 RepID=A0ABM1AEE1_APLCA|nr:E3 ubiquitin-protein ligase MIB2 [Aplysia californica]